MSERSERRRRERKKNKKAPGLNLVSLMDIFTILVFFLLVNSSSSQQPQSGALKLPEAKIETPIADQLLVQIDASSLVVQGRVILDLNELGGSLDSQSEEPIAALVEELRYQAARQQIEESPALTLMADRDLPFALLKRIMLSGTEAGYGQISLAVIGQAQAAD